MDETAKISEARNGWFDRIGIAKDGLDLARQILILAILLLFIIWPTRLKQSLNELGFTEVNVGGAKLTLAASEKAGDAAQRLAETKKTVEAAEKKVNSLAEQTNNPEIKIELERVESTLNQLSENYESAHQDLNATLAAQASVIQHAGPQDIPDSDSWGIVISGNKKLDPDAKEDAAKAKNAGFSNVKIYDRQDWFRTVVEFSSFSDAQAALPRLRAIPNYASAYLVNMAKWCPTRKDIGNGTLQCVAS